MTKGQPVTLLYHGTSTARLAKIFRDGELVVSKTGNPVVSLTTDVSVSSYWAGQSSETDIAEGCPSALPVIIVFRSQDLIERGVFITHFSDGVWGAGACDWEKEVAAWNNIRISTAHDIVTVDKSTYWRNHEESS